MSDAQTWTLIGGFLALMTAMSSLLLRVVKVEIGSVRTELGSDSTSLRGDIERLGTDLRGDIERLGTDLRGEMSTMRAELRGEIAVIGTKVDNLDRDVQILFNREFGAGPDAS